MFNKGSYPLLFAFVDSYGGMSSTFSIGFDIVPRGVFESFEGELSSVTDEKDYLITVDYSKADKYYITALRTGTGGFVCTVYNPDGSKVAGTEYFSVSGPAAGQTVKDGLELIKPDGVTGTYTYSLRINTLENRYVDGDTRYKIAYGEDSQKAYFFEDYTDNLTLPYYHTIRNTTQQVEAQYTNFSLSTSDYGDYYKFTATGTETVILSSSYGQCRFKILDPNTMETLYDGRDLSTFQFTQVGDLVTAHFIKANINFTAGQTYLMVVYAPVGSTNPGYYDISVGETRVYSDSIKVPLSERYVTKGNPYIWSFKLSSQTGQPAYIDYVYYTGTQAGWPYEGGAYYILTPGSNNWLSNGATYWPKIQFNYTDLNSKLVRFDGNWQFRIIAGQTGLYPGNHVTINYYFEL